MSVLFKFAASGPLMAVLAVAIIKILGEGGFSFVYLVQDESSGVSLCSQLLLCTTVTTVPWQRQFALKKIRCPTGPEGVAVAMREVEAYRRFK
jgi:serine/threonine kinase 16